MGLLYVAFKSLARAVLPTGLSSWLYSGRSATSQCVLRLKAFLETSASHDELYDDTYYRRQDLVMSKCTQIMADTLVSAFHPAHAIDVGCGSGALLLALRERGVAVQGYECSKAALDLCRQKGLSVTAVDVVSCKADDMPTADLVISIEVAEHLPESAADPFVLLMVQASERWIIMTAATPGQGGTNHVNEQPHEYWIAKAMAAGAEYDHARTCEIRHLWQQCGVEAHRARNVLVFAVPRNRN